MKLKSAAPLLLLLALSGVALAETSTGDPQEESCPMTGDVSRVSEECRAFRVAFRAEVTACIDQVLLAARLGRGAALHAQTNRTAFLICDAEVRAKLGLPSN